MKYDAVVVGAGLSGSTSARILAESGKQVLIIERLKTVGGHCSDYLNEHGIMIHRYGPHIFHTTKRQVWQFISGFTDFHLYQHRVMSYAQGRLYPFPINRDTLVQIFGVSMGIYDVEKFLEREAKGSHFKNPPENFRDAVVSQVGEKLYEMFYKNFGFVPKKWIYGYAHAIADQRGYDRMNPRENLKYVLILIRGSITSLLRWKQGLSAGDVRMIIAWGVNSFINAIRHG